MSKASLVLAPLFGLALLCGCPPEDDVVCEPEFVGEEGQPVELEIVHRTALGALIEGTEGGDVELFRPPQGGKVFLTAARVRNVQKCGLRLRAAIVDQEADDRVIGLESRPFSTRVTDDGWLEPLNPAALSSWANVPACPSRAATRQVAGATYKLNVQIEDTEGNSAEKELMVVPRCVQPGFLGEQCSCECRAEYVLGDRCDEPDGGAALIDAGTNHPAADGGSPNDAGI